jgi:hypothetical protein
MCAWAAEMPREPILRDSDMSGECVCVDSSMVSKRGGGLGSRKSMKPLGFRVDESELLRSSSGVLAKRDHHELLRRMGWLVESRIEDSLGECGGLTCCSEEVLWEDDEFVFEREFCEACSTRGDSGTKSPLGVSVVRSAVGRTGKSSCDSGSGPER